MDGLTVAVIAVAFYIAWNIGSNDSANAMGTAVAPGYSASVRPRSP